MNNKFAQLMLMLSKLDRRTIQFVYLAVALTGAVILRSPYDGGGGGI